MAGKRDKSYPTKRRRRFARSMLLIAVGAVIVFLVFERAGSKLCKPFLLYAQIRKEVQTIEAENAKLRQENKDLAARRDQLKTKSGAIAEARKLGFVRKGEKVVVEESPAQKVPKAN